MTSKRWIIQIDSISIVFARPVPMGKEPGPPTNSGPPTKPGPSYFIITNPRSTCTSILVAGRFVCFGCLSTSSPEELQTAKIHVLVDSYPSDVDIWLTCHFAIIVYKHAYKPGDNRHWTIFVQTDYRRVIMLGSVCHHSSADDDAWLLLLQTQLPLATTCDSGRSVLPVDLIWQQRQQGLYLQQTVTTRSYGSRLRSGRGSHAQLLSPAGSHWGRLDCKTLMMTMTTISMTTGASTASRTYQPASDRPKTISGTMKNRKIR